MVRGWAPRDPRGVPQAADAFGESILGTVKHGRDRPDRRETDV